MKKRFKKIDSRRTDYFVQKKIKNIDYKDVKSLMLFINPQGRIVKKKNTRLTAKNQRKISKNIKTARQMGLISNQIIEQELKEREEKTKKENN